MFSQFMKWLSPSAANKQFARKAFINLLKIFKEFMIICAFALFFGSLVLYFKYVLGFVAILFVLWLCWLVWAAIIPTYKENHSISKGE